MQINQKELVLLQYPFSNLKAKKVRPAIIVSNDEFNKKSDDCVLLPLTTVIKTEPYSIIINQNDLISGKLLKQSRIRVDKIFTIQKDLIIAKIGKVTDINFEKIKQEIFKIF